MSAQRRFIEDADERTFLDDEVRHGAVVSQLMLIGEAVRRLSSEFCREHASIPWRPIAGMRNRLIHHYDQLDLPLVWMTAYRDIPQLASELEKDLPEDEDASA